MRGAAAPREKVSREQQKSHSLAVLEHLESTQNEGLNYSIKRIIPEG